MTQEELKQRLIELLNETFAEQYDKRGLLTAPHTAEALLANGVTIRERGEWIPVTERLPDKDGYYLAHDLGVDRGISTKEIRIKYFKSGEKHCDFRWKNHITHWMPLPLPPEIEEGDKGK